MRENSLKYYLFIFCGLILFSPLAKSQTATQDTSIHKVLMVPFGRFNFFTDYPLSLIDSINHLASGETYEAFKDSISSFFASQKSSKWKYFSMPQTDIGKLQQHFTYKYKRKPVNHFGIKMLSGFDDMALAIMQKNYADAILFFTDYKIKKAQVLYSPNNGTAHLKSYATHITQAVLITKSGEYYANGNIKIKDAPQTPENIAKRNLSIEGSNDSYQALAKEMPKLLRSKKKK